MALMLVTLKTFLPEIFPLKGVLLNMYPMLVTLLMAKSIPTQAYDCKVVSLLFQHNVIHLITSYHTFSHYITKLLQ